MRTLRRLIGLLKLDKPFSELVQMLMNRNSGNVPSRAPTSPAVNQYLDTPSPEAAPVAQPQEVTSPFSREAVELIKHHEGFSPTAYKDHNSRTTPWTIGYGHAGPNVKKGDKVSELDAEIRLLEDMKMVSKQIDNVVDVDLTPRQKEALVSFVYNVGIGNFQNSTLLKKLNEGNYKKAASEFEKWVYGAKNGRKVKLPGLLKRRAVERRIFESS